MFNIGFGEMLVIGVLALIFIGPKQLPDVARALAKMINEMKHAFSDVTSSFKKNKNNVDDWMKDLTSQIVNAGQNNQATGGQTKDSNSEVMGDEKKDEKKI